MKELVINYKKGVNEVLFGMTHENVKELMGEAENCTNTMHGDECIKRKETRGNVRYFYENNKLICISGELSAPFCLGGEKIPNTLFGAVRYLKSKSHLNMRFSDLTSYVFVDLGIVLYPYIINDIEAGVSFTTTSHRLAICKNEVLKRYSKIFCSKQTEKGNDLLLMEQIGCYLEEHDAVEHSQE